MPGVSIHYDIREAVVWLLQQQTFTGLSSSNIKNRSMPKKGETLDSLPCMLVVPYGGIDWSPLSFEGTVNRGYMVEVCVVAASNLDFSTAQEQHGGWLEKAVRAVTPETLQNSTPPVESVWRVEVLANPTFDRGKLAVMYSYQSIVLRFDSQEGRNSYDF